MEVWIRPRCAIGHERVHMQLVLDSQVHVLHEGQLPSAGAWLLKERFRQRGIPLPNICARDHAPINSVFLTGP